MSYSRTLAIDMLSMKTSWLERKAIGWVTKMMVFQATMAVFHGRISHSGSICRSVVQPSKYDEFESVKLLDRLITPWTKKTKTGGLPHFVDMVPRYYRRIC